MDMCVILTHCAHVAREDFEYILSECANLASFSFHPHPHSKFSYSLGPPTRDLPNDYAGFNPMWILDFVPGVAESPVAQRLSRLQTLEVTLTLSRASLFAFASILSCNNRLTSLTLGNISDEPIVLLDSMTSLPDVALNMLTTLFIYCDCAPFVEYVSTRWSMPRLEQLTCVHAEDIPVSLLKAHASNLTYLNLTYSQYRVRYDDANTEFLPRLHELCPKISHLAMPLPDDALSALEVHSPTLRYLDIANSFVFSYRTTALSPTARAPQLKKVRFVAVGMIFGLPSLPLVFHPSLVPGSDRVFEDVPEFSDPDESDEHVDWLVRTTGGVETALPEALVRQHSWAVVEDILFDGGEHPGAEGDPRVPDYDDSDSEGEYVYRSMPTSPVDSETEASGSDLEGETDGTFDQCQSGQEFHGNMDQDHSDSDETDSDMVREWFEVEPEEPPYPNKVQFVDDPLDSSRGQYSREAVLEAFSRSQLGDYLLD